MNDEPAGARTRPQPQPQPEVLRLRGSDLSKIAGLHPWAELNILFTEHLYQNQSELRKHDANDLGIIFVSEEQALQELLLKADVGTREAFNAAVIAQPTSMESAATTRKMVGLLLSRGY